MRLSRSALVTAVLGLVGVTLFALLIRRMDLEKVGSAIAEIGPFPIIASLVLVHVGIFLYAVGWYVLLGGGLGIVDSYLIAWGGIFANKIIPAGILSGDAARIYYANRLGKLSVPRVASSVTSHRITMLFPFVVYVGMGALYLVMTGMEGSGVGVRILLTTLTASLLVIAALIMTTNEKVLMKLIDTAERLTKKDASWARRMALEYVRGFSLLRRNRGLLVRASLCSFTSWLLDVLPIFVLFRALGVEIPVLAGILVYSVNIIMLRLPLGIPGNVGVREWASVELLRAIGMGKEMAFVVTLVAADVVVLLNQLVSGLLAYLILLKRG